MTENRINSRYGSGSNQLTDRIYERLRARQTSNEDIKAITNVYSNLGFEHTNKDGKVLGVAYPGGSALMAALIKVNYDVTVFDAMARLAKLEYPKYKDVSPSNILLMVINTRLFGYLELLKKQQI